MEQRRGRGEKGGKPHSHAAAFVVVVMFAACSRGHSQQAGLVTNYDDEPMPGWN